MPKPSFGLIKNKIDSARHILIASHVSPDFDAVASVLALARLIRSRKKATSLYIPSFDASVWQEVPGAHTIKTKLPKKRVDLVFALDYAKMERLGIHRVLERDNPFVISFDHHPPQDQKGNIVWVDVKKAAVAEMIYDMARAWKLRLDRETAFLMLLGIVGDTVGLAIQSVTPRVLRIVGDLITKGGDLARAQALREEWESPEDLKWFGYAVSRAIFYPKLKFATLVIKQKMVKRMKARQDSAARIANVLRLVRGIEIALVLAEANGKKGGWNGHLRSRAESRVDLGFVARYFDGGGHFHAAGFRTMLPASKIITKVRELLSRE